MAGKIHTLVTGGFGYIGWRITNRLRSAGHHVTVLSRNRIEGDRESVDWIRCDISNRSEMEAALRGREFEFIVHAAATQDAKWIESVNVHGTQTLWKSLSIKPRKIVYLSTVHVYGQLAGDITEDTQPAPVSAYAESKLQGETITGDYASDAAILRVANGYGCPDSCEGPEWNLLSNNLVQMACDQNELVLRSNPNMARDFIWIENLVDAVSEILHDPNQVAGVFNCASENSQSLKSVAEKVKGIGDEKLRRHILLRFDGATSEAHSPFRIQSGKLRSTISLTPSDRFENEISRTFDFLMKQAK